jgi:hypothetical protein
MLVDNNNEDHNRVLCIITIALSLVALSIPIIVLEIYVF